MNKTIIITKHDCPHCVEAKRILTDELNVDFFEEEIFSRLELHHALDYFKEKYGVEYPRDTGEYTTVPQIILNGEFVGGCDDLKAKLLAEAKPALNTKVTTDRANKKTVFNANNTGNETGKYPLFLGEDPGFKDTIHMQYPILDHLYQLQVSQIWNENEVDLTQDRMDMINADPKVVEMMVRTILWQSLADSIASRAISGILLRHVTNPQLEDWYNAVALFESIHSRTYLHIIKQTFVDPEEALRMGYEMVEAIQRSEVLRCAFDDLMNLPPDAPEDVVREHVYIAIATLYMLERINFMSSFAITFGIAELELFQGISQDVVLICRDEILHAEGGRQILKIEMAEHPEVFNKLRPRMQQLFDEVKNMEYSWTDDLFSEGRGFLGSSAQGVKDYVDYMSQDVADTLGLVTRKVDKNPLPYMDNYIDTSKVQEAAQEIQLTKYLLNAVSAPKDLQGLLANLKGKYAH